MRRTVISWGWLVGDKAARYTEVILHCAREEYEVCKGSDMIIDETLLNQVSAQAKASPRLRMNYNFHQSLDDKCHRFLNAVEPGTVVPIHRHPTKDESFVILRGKVRVTTHNDDGSIIEDVVLSQESDNYGVDIPKNVWHKLESLEAGSVIFECKEGPFVEHEVEGILEVPKK